MNEFKVPKGSWDRFPLSLLVRESDRSMNCFSSKQFISVASRNHSRTKLLIAFPLPEALDHCPREAAWPDGHQLFLINKPFLHLSP